MITNTFPCGGWLHKIGRRTSPGCELCKKAKERQGECTGDSLPRESIGHIQSDGCLGQSDVVTVAHNKCIRDLLGDIQMHQKKGSKLVMVTTVSERTIGKLWALAASRATPPGRGRMSVREEGVGEGSARRP